MKFHSIGVIMKTLQKANETNLETKDYDIYLF